MTTFERKEVLLSVDGVCKSFDKPVLRDVTFQIQNVIRPNVTQGQIVAIVGKSGCGKSTLFNIMAALLKPDKGEVRISYACKAPPVILGQMYPVEEGDMGIVYQNSWVYSWRTVKSILYKAASKNPAYAGGEKGKAVAVLANQLDITKLMDKYPSQLSGGQRQRVAIAEQVLNGGDFILLDEPFSGLDTLTIDKVTRMLVDISLTCEKKTLVLVSHDLSNSLAICDTAYILSCPPGYEGSSITNIIDLASAGLAWRDDIKEDPVFRSMLKDVKVML